MSNKETTEPACRGCALMLAIRCYELHWWFRIIREPLLLGMRYLAWYNCIDTKNKSFRDGKCKGCIRFMKTELEKKSSTFNFLNRFIGPWFGNLRNGMLTPEELQKAKEIAQEAMH